MSSDNVVRETPSSFEKNDIEKAGVLNSATEVAEPTEGLEDIDRFSRKLSQYPILRKLVEYGVELRGVQPVPEALRTDTRFINIFTVFATPMCSLLPLTSGIVGTLSYGMSLRDTSLMIIFLSFLFCIPPAYMLTLSPRTGMRQMIQARYSFGFYPNILPIILNMCSIMGYSMVCAVVGGQALSAVSNGRLSTDVGVVIVCVLSMFVPLGGYKYVHMYLRWSWIPCVISLIICCGVGGSNLKKQVATAPAEATTYITFASLLAGYYIPYGSTVGDLAVYMPKTAPRFRLFLYMLLGVTVPSILLMILGAAIGATVPVIPDWETAYSTYSIGGIMEAMLHPAGGFGKFITVILALSVLGTPMSSGYTLSLNFQMMMPGMQRIPRILLVFVAVGIMIGVGIAAAESFMDSLQAFLGIIGYWSAGFVGVMLTEWFWFRKARPETMDPAIWNSPRQLPSGIPALAALIIPFVLVVPAMDQIWYVGPIAKVTGDLGFELELVTSILLYVPFRMIEMKYFRDGRL